MGLNFIGCELNPEYCRMGRRRIDRAMDTEPETAEVPGQLDFPEFRSDYVRITG